MKIETKFNVGDMVWWKAPFSRKITPTKITGIQIYIGTGDTTILYKHSKGNSSEPEGCFYKTKGEAGERI